MNEVTDIRLNATVEVGQADDMYVDYVEINREDISAATEPAGKLTVTWGKLKLDR